jgi:SAM-dependent methyltransferase
MSASAGFAPAGSIRSFTYRSLWRCADGLQKAANACLLMAGAMLRKQELKAASQAHWRRFANTDAAVDAGLEIWEQRLYADLLEPADRILIVGCGAGRDLLALRASGYDVTGLDHTPELIEMARGHLERRGLTAPLVCGFMEDTEPTTAFDVIVFSGSSYSYVPGSASRVATLARFARRLSPRGRLVITFSAVGRQSPWATRLMYLGRLIGGADWHAEPGDSFTRGFLAPDVLMYQHVFRPGEVLEECARAGLRVTRDEFVDLAHYVVAVRAS